MEANAKMTVNAHKFALLAKMYPDKPLEEILKLWTNTPGVDINTAIWHAVTLGLVQDPVAGKPVVFVTAPDQWEFGQAVEDLRFELMYALHKMAEKEQDMDENFLGNWTLGYMPHDIMIAVDSLLDEKKLTRYTLTDPNDLKSTYTFYTLYENGEQMWGRKFFKEQPTGAETPDNNEEESEQENV